MPPTCHLPLTSSRRLSRHAPQDDMNDLIETYNRIRGSLLYDFIFYNATSATSPSSSNSAADTSSDTSYSCFVSKSHGRKREPGHIPRPPNAFLTFRSYLCAVDDIICDGNQREVSRDAGKRWKQLDEDEKARFKALANDIKAVHNRLWPDHRYNPKQDQQGKSKTKKKGSKPHTESLCVKAPVCETSEDAVSAKILPTASQLKFSRPLSPDRQAQTMQLPPLASIVPSSRLQDVWDHVAQDDAANAPVMPMPDARDIPNLTYPEDDFENDYGATADTSLWTLDEEMTSTMNFSCYSLTLLPPDDALKTIDVKSQPLDFVHSCFVQQDSFPLLDEDIIVTPSSKPVPMDFAFIGTTSLPLTPCSGGEDPFRIVFPELCSFPSEESVVYQLAPAVDYDHSYNEQWVS